MIKLKDINLARILYDSFKIPKQKPKYKPINLTIDIS
ncbi:hypothetical SULF integrase [Sulfolobus acidocaldarius DSM 639]|uniref:Hypothetical SULF integrase n=1 Tax=Sulfolobus acidocaldarius (strain ATCC 33909 / DSM 639 / JCM 8929 / NBRC 15157 / NCIMB 11770) TaxID=330779 RepID=Q4JAX0_SULAC|nr:hypothetical SULF integrase [Sulfolobus acidocaldarius DSM 639]